MGRQPLRPPYLELGFYFAEVADDEAFGQVVAALWELGATFAGEGRVQRASGIKRTPLQTIWALDSELVPVASMAQVNEYLDDPDVRLSQVVVKGASGLGRNVTEVVTFLNGTPGEVLSQRHPIAIWTDGGQRFGPLDLIDKRQARLAGRLIYKRFRQLVARLRPSYAAITVEEDLPAPEGLRHDPRSLAFRDFYVATSYLGSARVERVRRAHAAAYCEELAEGVYIANSAMFNPAGLEVEHGASSLASTAVGRLIAGVLGGYS